MKIIFRKLLFSFLALYLTSYWNQGFIIRQEPTVFLKASLITALIYYLIVPLSKIIFFPLNLISLGFVSVFFYSLVLYFILTNLSLVEVKSWIFLNYQIDWLTNIFLISFSISLIINLLEKII